jgi:ABC-2 type transport system permease protein
LIARPLAVAWKELVQLRRDRLTAGMAVGIPLIQLTLFGYAINTDVRHIPLAVYDQDASTASRDLAHSLAATGFYELVGQVRSPDEIERALRSGRARATLVVPPRYGSNVRRGTPARVQLVVDGSDPQTVASATSTATGLVAARARRGPIALEPRIRYNPEQRTAVFVVPGLTGVILSLTMIMLTAMAIARERERGTLEQLIVSPVGRVELVVGKIVPYIGIGYLQMTLILTVGALLFRVPFAGSVPLLYLLAFLFIAANLGLGLFFSTLARTQQQAMQMSFFFLLPNILLSGFMFPFEAMPEPTRLLGQLLPLTHFLRIVRGIALKGAGFADLQGEVAWLAAILVVLVALAAARFRKKID